MSINFTYEFIFMYPTPPLNDPAGYTTQVPIILYIGTYCVLYTRNNNIPKFKVHPKLVIVIIQ